jgi:hypothetical protein
MSLARFLSFSRAIDLAPAKSETHAIFFLFDPSFFFASQEAMKSMAGLLSCKFVPLSLVGTRSYPVTGRSGLAEVFYSIFQSKMSSDDDDSSAQGNVTLRDECTAAVIIRPPETSVKPAGNF